MYFHFTMLPINFFKQFVLVHSAYNDILTFLTILLVPTHKTKQFETYFSLQQPQNLIADHKVLNFICPHLIEDPFLIHLSSGFLIDQKRSAKDKRETGTHFAILDCWHLYTFILSIKLTRWLVQTAGLYILILDFTMN